MTTARGWRKWSIILILLLPTLTGITFVNLIPMIYNVQLSFTNADRLSHNGRDAAHAYDNIGLKNYQDLIAELLTNDAAVAVVKLFAVLIPLIAASIIARRMTHKVLSPPDTRFVWLGGLAGMIILWVLLGGGAA